MSTIGQVIGGTGRLNPPRMPAKDRLKPKRDAYEPPKKMPPGWVFIHCSEPAAQFQVMLGKAPFIPTEGWGGYEVVDRPQQVSMTVESTTPPWQYTGSLRFEGYRGWRSQEDDLAKLRLMAHGDDNNNPGIISIVGIPRLPAEDWIIESLAFEEDSIIRHPYTFEIIRAEVQIVIREYVSPRYMRLKKDATKPPKGNYTFVKVSKGDTPHRLAVRYKCSVRDIKELNPKIKPPITKANQKLKQGITLRVPIPNSKRQKDKKNRTKSRG